jgi:hypothetical protein
VYRGYFLDRRAPHRPDTSEVGGEAVPAGGESGMSFTSSLPSPVLVFRSSSQTLKAAAIQAPPVIAPPRNHNECASHACARHRGDRFPASARRGHQAGQRRPRHCERGDLSPHVFPSSRHASRSRPCTTVLRDPPSQGRCRAVFPRSKPGWHRSRESYESSKITEIEYFGVSHHENVRGSCYGNIRK